MKKQKGFKAKKRLKGPAANLFITVVFIVLVLYALSQVFVLGWGLMTSLKDELEFSFSALKFPDVNGISKEAFWDLKYYKNLSNVNISKSIGYYSRGQEITGEVDAGLLDMLLNSILYVVIAGSVRTIVPCIVAYMCSKYNYKLSKFVVAFAVVVLSVHIVGAEPASVKLLRDLGLYNSLLGVAAQQSTFLGMYFLIFLAFFDGMSNGYTEAAEIDGASQLRTMISIALPLASKTIITIFLLNGIAFWNDYNTPLLYLPSYPTLAYGIYYANTTTDSSLNLNSVPAKIACGMVLAVPMIIIFVAFRNRLMGNVTMGGLKE
jgi:ABC-type glycerol-3-phosphate transport system permease component